LLPPLIISFSIALWKIIQIFQCIQIFYNHKR
jgi:hypothetical protein